jgi:NACalpha-BTF3-like transcription factor
VSGLQVVRKGDDAKAHKELNALGGDGGGEKEMDTAKAQDALSQLESAAAAEKAARLERERELAKVKIDNTDVKLIMDGKFLKRLCCMIVFCCRQDVLVLCPDGIGSRCTEMEIEEAKAERVLRENNGDAVAALRSLVNSV